MLLTKRNVGRVECSAARARRARRSGVSAQAAELLVQQPSALASPHLVPRAATMPLWGGRFTGKTDPVMHQFNLSLDVDKVMWAADIDGSVAYSRALERAKVRDAMRADELLS